LAKRDDISSMGQLTDTRLRQILPQISLVCLDVDGVLTDGGLYYSTEGVLLKRFHVHDGHGIRSLGKAGLRVALLTGRDDPLVARRAHELGIDKYIAGCNDKEKSMRELCGSWGLDLAQVAYMGDDVPDLNAVHKAGLGAAPADAQAEILHVADWISQHGGGHGAVRELCDLIISSQK
jgi:3-deoxy-D-manno-octulosonate 8-phosphate phosphatase (KDO 8-P phosphatase)